MNEEIEQDANKSQEHIGAHDKTVCDPRVTEIIDARIAEITGGQK